MILISHDLGVIAEVAETVAIMYAGKIVEKGSAMDVFHNAKHPYTQGLLSCIPVPGRTRSGERLGVIPGTVPSLVGPLGGCLFRERCGYAAPPCTLAPPYRSNAEDHAWRCILEDA